MTISPATGVVQWQNPSVGGFTIVIAASGPGGFDVEGWTLTISPPEAPQRIFRVSLSSDGGAPNRASTEATVSRDGRWVSFVSESSNIVPEVDDEQADVYLHDRQTGRTIVLSPTADGRVPRPSRGPIVSANGAVVAFTSFDIDLVPGDTNNEADIFVYSIASGVTTRATLGPGGIEADGSSDNAALSADGNFLVFDSSATNLVPDDTNEAPDVFLLIRSTGRLRRVSVNSFGEQGNAESVRPSISEDGRAIAFLSRATNLVPGNTNELGDVFVHDTLTGETVRVPPTTIDGEPPNGEAQHVHIAGPNGRYVVLATQASNFVAGDDDRATDVIWHDRETGEVRLVSVALDGRPGNGASTWPMVSSDGKLVVFHSEASNLVAGDTNRRIDVFIRNMETGVTTLWSRNDAGELGNGASLRPFLTSDGRFLTFESKATNLSLDDSNDLSDVFLRDLLESE